MTDLHVSAFGSWYDVLHGHVNWRVVWAVQNCLEGLIIPNGLYEGTLHLLVS